jgi:hypothetical protein
LGETWRKSEEWAIGEVALWLRTEMGWKADEAKATLRPVEAHNLPALALGAHRHPCLTEHPGEVVAG